MTIMSSNDDLEFGGAPDPASSATLDVSHGVVSIDGKDWAVGLIWNSSEGSVATSRHARAMAREEGVDADFFCLRPQSSQYGLGFRYSSHRAGLPSLAVQLAHNQKDAEKREAWIGAWSVDGGYYVFAMHNDGILSQLERFFDSEDEARDAVHEVMYQYGSESDWKLIIAPESFGIEDAEDLPIEDFIGGRAATRLSSVARTGNMVKLGVLVLAAACVFGATAWYMSMDRMQESQDRLRSILNDAKQVAPGIARKNDPEIPSMPWEGKPVGVSFLATCIAEMKRFPFDVPGWRATTLACESGSVAVLLKRDGNLEVSYGNGAASGLPGGTINWIAPAVNREGFRPGIAPQGDDAASVSWRMPETESHPIEVETVSLRGARRYLVSQFEEMRTRITAEAGKGTEFYATLDFSFTTPYDPIAFSSVLARVPALVIDRVSLNPESWQWSIEGHVYEQLTIPPSKR